MVIALQIVLLLIILGTGIGASIEKENKDLRGTMLSVFIASNAAFIVSVVWL